MAEVSIHALDDDGTILEVVTDFFETMGLPVHTASTAESFMKGLPSDLGGPIEDAQDRLHVLLLDGYNEHDPDGHAARMVEALSDRLMTRAELMEQASRDREALLGANQAHRKAFALLITAGLQSGLAQATWQLIDRGLLLGAVGKPLSYMQLLQIIQGLASNDQEVLISAISGLQAQTERVAQGCPTIQFHPFLDGSC